MSQSIRISFDIDQMVLDHQRNKPRSYAAVHRWLRSNFGVANRCENEQCNDPSKFFQWAKLKDKDYDYKRENFIMLCARCHYYYDEKFKRHQKVGLKKKTYGQLKLFHDDQIGA